MAVTPTPPATINIHHGKGGGVSVGLKVAVIDLLADMVIFVGFTKPDKSPLQELNFQPLAGDAVKVTVVPEGYVA